MANLDITKNFAKSTVSTGYDSSATEIVLVSWWGSVFPDPAVDWAFNLLWWDRSTFIDPFDDPNKEIVRCTAISWDTLTIIRAQEWTLATNKNTIWSWYDIALVLTKKTIDDIWTELDAKLEDITSESIWDLSNVDLTWVADWKVLRYNWTSEKFEVSDAWIWDMVASTYDPTGVEGDAFDMDNMAQGTTNKFISAAELTVLQNTSGINTGDQEASDFDIKDLTDSNDLRTTWSGKQDALVSGTNIKTINSESLLGGGDIAITVPTKATGSEVNTGTDDVKYVTPKAIADSDYIKVGDILNSQSIASASSITPTGNYKENEYYVTALADDLTINAPSGTASNGNTLLIRIKDNGTSRALTWNAIYTFIGTTKPETTVISKVLYIGAIYNSTSSKWEVVSVNEEE